MTDRIALGTVQFGMAYGIANSFGQVQAHEVTNILSTARAAGIDTLDTAALYGASETVLGTAGAKSFRIVSKLPAVPEDCQNLEDWVRDQVMGCLRRLRTAKLYGLLLHRPGDLQCRYGDKLYNALVGLKVDNFVSKIGYSIYASDELDALFVSFPPDIVQAPFNVFDRRLRSSGWLERMSKSNVEVHVRSAFLQGLLLCSRGAVPRKFAPWADLFERWHAWCANNGVSQLDAALGHALSATGVDRVVVGVDSTAQLEQILASGRRISPPVPEEIQGHGALINPSLWGTL